MTLRLPRDLWGVYRQPPQFRFGTVTSVSPGICTVQVAGGEIPVIYFKNAAPSVGDFVSVQRQSVVSYLMTAPAAGGVVMLGGSSQPNAVAVVSPTSGAAAASVVLSLPSGYGLANAAQLGSSSLLVAVYGATLTEGLVYALSLPELAVTGSAQAPGQTGTIGGQSPSGVVACLVANTGSAAGYSGVMVVEPSLAISTYAFSQPMNNIGATWSASSGLLWIVAQAAGASSAPFQVFSLDVSTGAYSAPFEPFPSTAQHPFSGPVVDETSGIFLVADFLVAAAYAVDLGSGTLSATIPLEAAAGFGPAVEDQKRRNWYVPVATSTGSLQVISAETYATVATLPLPEAYNELNNMVSDDSNGKLYIGADASTVGPSGFSDVIITVDELTLTRTATTNTGDWEGPWALG